LSFISVFGEYNRARFSYKECQDVFGSLWNEYSAYIPEQLL